MTKINTVCSRLKLNMVPGVPFLDLSEHDEALPPEFDWRGESEQAGGKRAQEWLQQHIAPKGVVVELVPSETWINATWDEVNVHIKDSKTDLVFLLEESRQACLQGSPLSEKLTFMLGQCETKLTEEFTADSRAQGAAEHLGAEWKFLSSLQDGRITATWPLLTIVSDLRDQWALICTEEGAPGERKDLIIYSYAGGRSAAGPAIRQAKQHLQNTATSARAALTARGILRPPGAADGRGRCRADDDEGKKAGQGKRRAKGHSEQRGRTRSKAGAKGRQKAGSSAGHQQRQETSAHLLHSVVCLPASLPLDSDLERELDAIYSADLVALLRDPLGYRDLLGLSSPPTSI